LYRAWEVVVELNDPQDDWDAALRHIDEKARP
jgi:hypothetical protein